MVKINFKNIKSWWWAIMWFLIVIIVSINNINNKRNNIYIDRGNDYINNQQQTFEEIFNIERNNAIKSCMTVGTTSLTFCECVTDYLMKDIHSKEDLQSLNSWSEKRLNELSDEASHYCREW